MKCIIEKLSWIYKLEILEMSAAKIGTYREMLLCGSSLVRRGFSAETEPQGNTQTEHFNLNSSILSKLIFFLSTGRMLKSFQILDIWIGMLNLYNPCEYSNRKKHCDIWNTSCLSQIFQIQDTYPGCNICVYMHICTKSDLCMLICSKRLVLMSWLLSLWRLTDVTSAGQATKMETQIFFCV